MAKPSPFLFAVLFCLLGLLWGGSFVGIKFVIEDLPPFFGAGIRLAIAVTFLGGFLLWSKDTFKIPQGMHLRVWATGVLSLGLPFALLFWGEQRTSAGIGGI